MIDIRELVWKIGAIGSEEDSATFGVSYEETLCRHIVLYIERGYLEVSERVGLSFFERAAKHRVKRFTFEDVLVCTDYNTIL